mmetsp:Transcript_8727/g.17108  ORF Transcript_8727/g.17108 Transcript_8727/m.17108 type:complete len:128 (+) Transcript_8727:136-519(+)
MHTLPHVRPMHMHRPPLLARSASMRLIFASYCGQSKLHILLDAIRCGGAQAKYVLRLYVSLQRPAATARTSVEKGDKNYYQKKNSGNHEKRIGCGMMPCGRGRKKRKKKKARGRYGWKNQSITEVRD